MNQDYQRLCSAFSEIFDANIMLRKNTGEGKRNALLFFSILSQLWLSGVDILWEMLFPNPRLQSRIPLPTYPFARKKCWIKSGSNSKKIFQKSTQQKVGDTNHKNVETALCNLWKDFLGVKQVNPDDDFFDLGGDSLRAVTLVEAMNQRLGFQLDVDALLTTPTISQLLTHYTQEKETKNSKFPFCIVPLSQGNSRRSPLFLIHPVGGTVYFYRELVAELDSEQPVFGIQAQSLDGKTSPKSSIESLATNYVSMIQEIQTKGPYYLGGSSFGGIVAYEIALQLVKAREEIGLVTLIDSPGPGFMPKPLNSLEEIIKYILNTAKNKSVSLKKLYEMTEKEKYSILMDIPGNHSLSHKQLKLFVEIFQENMKAMFNYKPYTFSGKSVFFSAKERNEFIPDNLEMAWNPFIKDLDIIKIHGNHITMNSMPNVKHLAEFLQLYLYSHRV